MDTSLAERAGLTIVLAMLALSVICVIDAATGAHLARATVEFLVAHIRS